MKSLQNTPEIGDKLTVEIHTTNLNFDFPSQLLEKVDNEEFIISGPLNKNTIVPLVIGTNITLKYNKNNKGRFSFDAQIVGKSIDTLYKIKITRKSNIIKNQEREFFRLPVVLDINKIKKRHIIDEELIDDDNSEESAIIEDCITKDISGGGLRIRCNSNHELGELIYCKLNIEGNIMKFSGIIVRKDIEENNSEFKYSIGVKFENITTKHRERIIKYIFDKQRIYRKKGLI